jgi:ParB/RepB/Spo0J family partition protein
LYDPKRIYDIPLDEIDDNPDLNCRGIIDPLTVMGLGEDIRLNEQIHPVLLRPAERLTVVSGFRRVMACRVAKLKTVEARIKEMTAAQAKLINLAENADREPLGLQKEIEFLKSLQEEGHSVDELAATLHKSYVWVADRIAVGGLPSRWQELVYERVMTPTEAIEAYYGDSEEDEEEIINKYLRKRMMSDDCSPERTDKQLALLRKRLIESGVSVDDRAVRVLDWQLGELRDFREVLR